MKNSGQLILRESTKTVDQAEKSLTLKYTLTVDKDRDKCICDSGKCVNIADCTVKSDVGDVYDNEISLIYSLTVASFIDGVADDEQYFEDISRNKEEAEQIFDIMSENTVTPETAEYILEELISFGLEKIQYTDLSIC